MDEFDDRQFPLAYLITVRCYGTWLHGDKRLSVDRHGLNAYGTERRRGNEKLVNVMRENMSHEAVLLNDSQRKVVTEVINQVVVIETTVCVR